MLGSLQTGVLDGLLSGRRRWPLLFSLELGFDEVVYLWLLSIHQRIHGWLSISHSTLRRFFRCATLSQLVKASLLSNECVVNLI